MGVFEVASPRRGTGAIVEGKRHMAAHILQYKGRGQYPAVLEIVGVHLAIVGATGGYGWVVVRAQRRRSHPSSESRSSSAADTGSF